MSLLKTLTIISLQKIKMLPLFPKGKLLLVTFKRYFFLSFLFSLFCVGGQEEKGEGEHTRRYINVFIYIVVIKQFIFSFGFEPKLTLQKNAVLTIELRELIVLPLRSNFLSSFLSSICKKDGGQNRGKKQIQG